jgi:hypothetical protein
MGDEGCHDREAFIMSFLPIFGKRLSCLVGPEAAGQAPRTAERQMPPAAEAQTQELAPKPAQQAQFQLLTMCRIYIYIIESVHSS